MVDLIQRKLIVDEKPNEDKVKRVEPVTARVIIL
jgi:hypothetical protein